MQLYLNDLNGKKIVITGAPGTGKTSIIKSLENTGFYCYHEIIRTMTMEAKKTSDKEHFLNNPIDFVDDSKSFNKQLLTARLNQFLDGSKQSIETIFYDRGMPDVLAYMDYFKQPYDVQFKKPCEDYKYDAIILLPPWEAIYIQDDERLETYQQSVELHDHLFDTYTSFGYDVIDVPIGPVTDRMDFILNHFNLKGGS
ncbi:AAA family ATPase [Maribacter sp. CXY002]|uniref:AAA family ATPase n=1 Tax=Maribacter luteocoastalis TaxID=3407671 RepID=UPI003B66ED0A